MSILAYAIASILLGPPAPAPATESPQSSERDYEQIVAELVALNDRMNRGDDVSEQIGMTLAELTEHAPQLADDPATQELRTLALLNAARARLAADDLEAAQLLVDEAIRSALGAELPAEQFGPSLAALYEERRAALRDAGDGTIAVECGVPCRVFVDERHSGPLAAGLPFGEYRVWIEASDHDQPPFRGSVTLSEAQRTASLRYGDPSGPVEAPGPTRTRLLPLGSEVALVVLGVGVAALGGVLVAHNLDHRPMLIAGSTITALGGAALLTGSITLAIDEVHTNERRGRQVALVWTTRF